MTEFGKLTPEGGYTKVRSIPQSKMMECPFFIMVPEHYRESDDSCRCDDPTHTEKWPSGATSGTAAGGPKRPSRRVKRREEMTSTCTQRQP